MTNYQPDFTVEDQAEHTVLIVEVKTRAAAHRIDEYLKQFYTYAQRIDAIDALFVLVTSEHITLFRLESGRWENIAQIPTELAFRPIDADFERYRSDNRYLENLAYRWLWAMIDDRANGDTSTIIPSEVRQRMYLVRAQHAV